MSNGSAMHAKPCQRNGRQQGLRERGAGLVEYLGLILVLASLLAVSGGIAGGLARTEGGLAAQFRHGVCALQHKTMQVLGIEPRGRCPSGHEEKPQDAKPQDLPECRTYRQDRLMGANVDFRFIRAEVSGRDHIIHFVDPETGDEVSLVILANEGGIGVEAHTGRRISAGEFTEAVSRDGFNASAKAMLQAGAGALYEFDSPEDAQEFLDNHRGNTFKRVLGAIPGTSAVEGLYQGAKSLLGFDDKSEPAPVGVTAGVALQAEGWVTYEGGSVPGLKGKANFRTDLDAQGRATGRMRYKFDGSSLWMLRFNGEVGLKGGVGLSKKLQNKHPLLDGLGLTGGGRVEGAVEYRVWFDKDGTPDRLQVWTVTGKAGRGKAGGRNGSAELSRGSQNVHIYNLDLDDPKNMEALKGTFTDAVAAGSPAAPLVALTTDSPLGRRLAEDSVEYDLDYDTEGLDARAPDSSEESGLKVKGFGVGGNSQSRRLSLKSARYMDHSQPGAVWRELPNCTG